MVLLERDEYWQCGYVIRKGALEEKKKNGLENFRAEVGRCAAFVSDRTQELKSWDDIKLLTVKVDRLRKWHREGLLCIGDSAHAMSPVGGVGINLAIQDAVAAANILAPKFQNGGPSGSDLSDVQSRREFPARMTQRVQVFLHEHFLKQIFNATTQVQPPGPARLLEEFPLLRRIPARMIGIGFRPEHIRI